MAISTHAIELYSSRKRIRAKQKGALITVEGKRVWNVPQSELATAEAAAWDETWEVADATLEVTSVTSEPYVGVTPGKSKLTALYRGYDLTNFPIGGATVSTLSAKSLLKTEPTKEVFYDSKIVAVDAPEDANGLIYSIVGGAFYRHVPETVIQINTGVRREDFSLDLLDGANRINAGTFMGRPKWTLLIAGVTVPKAFLVDEDAQVIPVTYDLWYREDTWPWSADVQAYKDYVTVEKLVRLNAAGVEEGWWTPAGAFTDDEDAAGTTKTVRRVPYGSVRLWSPVHDMDTSTFTKLAGLLWW